MLTSPAATTGTTGELPLIGSSVGLLGWPGELPLTSLLVVEGCTVRPGAIRELTLPVWGTGEEWQHTTLHFYFNVYVLYLCYKVHVD